eukprot:2283252-Amphidinium_carterae.1
MQKRFKRLPTGVSLGNNYSLLSALSLFDSAFGCAQQSAKIFVIPRITFAICKQRSASSHGPWF